MPVMSADIRRKKIKYEAEGIKEESSEEEKKEETKEDNQEVETPEPKTEERIPLSDETPVGNFTWGLLKELEMTTDFESQEWFTELPENDKKLVRKLDRA